MENECLCLVCWSLSRSLFLRKGKGKEGPPHNSHFKLEKQNFFLLVLLPARALVLCVKNVVGRWVGGARGGKGNVYFSFPLFPPSSLSPFFSLFLHPTFYLCLLYLLNFSPLLSVPKLSLFSSYPLFFFWWPRRKNKKQNPKVLFRVFLLI